LFSVDGRWAKGGSAAPNLRKIARSGTIAAGEAGFQPQRRLDQRDFTGGDKKRLAAPQKTIYNRRAWNGTCLVAARYFPYGLIFHFGWEQRRVGSCVRGLVPANE